MGTFSELRFRIDLDSLWTAVESVLSTTNRFVLRDNDPRHRTASAGFWQVYFQ